MQHDTDLRSIRVKTGANNPTSLSMLLDAFSNERCSSGGDEVSADVLPHKLKLVMVGPHVRSSTCDDVALLGLVVDYRAFVQRITDIRVACKNTQRLLAQGKLACQKQKKSQDRGSK